MGKGGKCANKNDKFGEISKRQALTVVTPIEWKEKMFRFVSNSRGRERERGLRDPYLTKGGPGATCT